MSTKLLRIEESSAIPPVTFTVDETVVFLGLLRLVEVPADVQPLASRVAERVGHRLRSTLDRNFSRSLASVLSEEAEALRLVRLLQVSLDDLATLVTLVADLTEPHHRPVSMLAESELRARSLAGQLGGLAG